MRRHSLRQLGRSLRAHRCGLDAQEAGGVNKSTTEHFTAFSKSFQTISTNSTRPPTASSQTPTAWRHLLTSSGATGVPQRGSLTQHGTLARYASRRAALETRPSGMATSATRDALRQLRSGHTVNADKAAPGSRQQLVRFMSTSASKNKGLSSESTRLASQALALASIRGNYKSLLFFLPAGLILVPSAVVHMLSRNTQIDAVGIVPSEESSERDLFDTRGGIWFKLKLTGRAIILAALFTPSVLLGLIAMQFKPGWLREQFARLLHKTLEIAGPAFIKWGQWAAARPDIFPSDLCEELKKLHENAPSHSYVYTKSTVERDFGKPHHSVFLEFDQKTLG